MTECVLFTGTEIVLNQINVSCTYMMYAYAINVLYITHIVYQPLSIYQKTYIVHKIIILFLTHENNLKSCQLQAIYDIPQTKRK